MELFLRRTVTGTAMRAAAEDFDVVRLMGIPASRIIATAFLLSGLLAGLAAMLWVAQRASVDPLMGFTPVLKAFIAAVVGGLGSLPGAVAGGFLLGIIEVLLQATLPAADRALSRRHRAVGRHRRAAGPPARLDPRRPGPAKLI